MIETCKIVTGKYQPCAAPTLHKGSVHVTRGNDLRLEKSHVKYDLQRFSFPIGWRIHETVCLTGLYLLTLLRRLKQD